MAECGKFNDQGINVAAKAAILDVGEIGEVASTSEIIENAPTRISCLLCMNELLFHAPSAEAQRVRG